MTPSDPPNGDLRPERRYRRGNLPAPLRLGSKDGRIALEATHASDDVAVIRHTGEALQLSRRGGARLARWLNEWARPRTPIKLWGFAEIVAEFGISERTMTNWRKRPDFPRPLAELASGPVWEQEAVRTWVRNDRPRRGPKGKRRRKKPIRAAGHA